MAACPCAMGNALPTIQVSCCAISKKLDKGRHHVLRLLALCSVFVTIDISNCAGSRVFLVLQHVQTQACFENRLGCRSSSARDHLHVLRRPGHISAQRAADRHVPYQSATGAAKLGQRSQSQRPWVHFGAKTSPAQNLEDATNSWEVPPIWQASDADLGQA